MKILGLLDLLNWVNGRFSCIALAIVSVGDLLEYIKECPEPLDEALY
ncbi:MAG: glycosidase related protein [Firmicutes bacterium]|nr:glycosidase related protein [Bacillota bacterium]